MNRLQQWFQERDWTPFPFQEEAWNHYARRRSGLIHAPTGVGKTLAAWGGPLLEALDNHDDGKGCRVLWITPLRALAHDTAENLTATIRELDLPWTLECRTSDTSASMKARQRKSLPSTLVTTPESLSLLLTYPGVDERFRSLRCVVIDEWHELMGSKRGVQAELGIARLRSIRPDLVTWGLSATLGNLDSAMSCLLGSKHEDGVLVAGHLDKAFEVVTLLPEDSERFPWAGHLGLRLLDQVIDHIESAGSTLVFTNTRSQTEIWFRSLYNARPDWAEQLAIHHGSLDQKVRREVEQRLREGSLKAVVCTSSLDLGVDFTPVEQVIQIGSPKGVARLLQRAGRSGHQPGAVSRIIGVPTNALELMEFSAARAAAIARRIEPRHPIVGPLDVLIQHLVTVSAGDGFEPDALCDEVRTTHAYRDLTDEEWRWALEFVSFGGPSLRAYPEHARVTPVDDRWRISSSAIERRHRMMIGTITADSALRVKFMNGKTLGTIEESFIGRLKPGNRFVFAGRALELIRVRDMTAYVKRATSVRGAVPRWMGGRSPLSTELADAVRERLHEARHHEFADEEMEWIEPLLALQSRWSVIPARDEVLMEFMTKKRTHHAYVFTLAGRLVNEGLSALVAYRWTTKAPQTMTVTANDYGFELTSTHTIPADEASWREVLSSDNLLDDLLACLNATQMTQRAFRDIARIAGLVFAGTPNQRKSMRQLQASSDLFYQVFEEFDPSNCLLDQSRRDVLDREMELTRLRECLTELASRRFIMRHPQEFTPLAFPLWAERIRSQHLSTERWQDRIQRMVLDLESVADDQRNEQRIQPTP
ncbi:MAG: ligase-associated DNA damage response DEXH box helicase [Planctomycetota bacterium]